MAKRKKKFKGGVSRNAQRQAKGSQFGHLNLPKGLQVFKEEPKTRVSLDIMPYEVTINNHPDRDEEYEIAVPGTLWYKRPYWLHRNIGPNNDSIVCPTTAGQKCPICEYRAQLMKDGADWNDDSVKALRPSMRNLYVVIPKGQKNYEESPHIWDISQFLFQEKLNEEVQENEEYEAFPDLEEGHTLRIRFSEGTFGTNKFAETSRIDFQERKEPYEESILDEIPSLDEILEIPSFKAVEAMFFGGLDQDEAKDDDYNEDEDAVDTEQEQEEQEEDEEEEPQPATKPSRSKKGKGKDKSKKSKCPHGYEFGTDCEEYDECDDCEEWEACIDASEERG